MGRSEVETTSNGKEVVVLAQASDEGELDYGSSRAPGGSRGIWKDVLGGRIDRSWGWFVYVGRGQAFIQQILIRYLL